jgi:hypothetical protein
VFVPGAFAATVGDRVAYPTVQGILIYGIIIAGSQREKGIFAAMLA